MSKTYTFNAKDIMQDDPSDPKKSILTIPDEIMKAQGWTQGTKLKIEIGDQGTIIIQEVKKTVDKS
tara:strand:+ start:652 stop:849 length:198 start_codon:yes stop_codon:yes gene_type:complete